MFEVVPAERVNDPVADVTFPDPTDYDVVVPLGARWPVYDEALRRSLGRRGDADAAHSRPEAAIAPETNAPKVESSPMASVKTAPSIDVGDLDRVIQIGSTRTVASFLAATRANRPSARHQPQLPVPLHRRRKPAPRNRNAQAMV
jgi:hypothetical protein